MFTEKEIKTFGKDMYFEFNKKHNIDCKIKLIDEKDFWEIAKKSELVQDKIKKGIPISIGALVSHKLEGDIVYVSVDVINSLTNDSNFVKSIFLHEFFHIYLKSSIKNYNFREAKLSEERAKKEMKKEFPKLAKYLD